MSLSSLEMLFETNPSGIRDSNSLLSDTPSAKTCAIICSVSKTYENVCDDKGPSLSSWQQYDVNVTFSASPWSEMDRKKELRTSHLNVVYFRQDLHVTCTIRLSNNLIDGGQLRAKNNF